MCKEEVVKIDLIYNQIDFLIDTISRKNWTDLNFALIRFDLICFRPGKTKFVHNIGKVPMQRL